MKFNKLLMFLLTITVIDSTTNAMQYKQFDKYANSLNTGQMSNSISGLTVEKIERMYDESGRIDHRTGCIVSQNIAIQ